MIRAQNSGAIVVLKIPTILLFFISRVGMLHVWANK